MENRFWKDALKAGGVATIGAFVFYRIYLRLLDLGIFTKLTGTLTFVFISLVAVLTFCLAIAFLHKKGTTGGESMASLTEGWRDVSRINCKEPVGPDVVRAVNAMELLADAWNHVTIDRRRLHRMFWKPFDDLYQDLATCETVPPGHGKRCSEFLSQGIHEAHRRMKTFKA